MKALFSAERRPLWATSFICLVLYLAAGFSFENFMTLRVFLNFFGDNAFLGVIAVGMTLVILTGGIDLSVGSMAGCVSIMAATLVTKYHQSAALAFGIVLLFGLGVGAAQGYLIARFKLAPFLVTLGGLFFCRGVGLLISKEASPIKDPLVDTLSSPAFTVNKANVSWGMLIFLAVVLAIAFVLRQTRFGRTLFAIGGNSASAHLMGLPVNRSLILAYCLSGLLGAVGGILFTIYTASGDATACRGLELDAIAAVVIGGTLLSGGVGSVLGTVLGVLTIAIIQTAINFQGTLSSWWIKIAIGTLLLVFVLLQRWLSGKRAEV